jgi:hypothetical protein
LGDSHQLREVEAEHLLAALDAFRAETIRVDGFDVFVPTGILHDTANRDDDFRLRNDRIAKPVRED